MITRRTLLAGGMTCAALTLGTSIVAALGTPSSASQASGRAPYAAVFDSNDSVSEQFAEHCAARGMTTIASRDLAALWFGELSSRWLPSGRTLVGMTHASVLMCLEQFACDAGRRLAFRLDHCERAPGVFEHLVFGANARPRTVELAHDWPALLACDLAASHRRTAPRGVPIPRVDASALRADRRISWIIGGASRHGAYEDAA